MNTGIKQPVDTSVHDKRFVTLVAPSDKRDEHQEQEVENHIPETQNNQLYHTPSSLLAKCTKVQKFAQIPKIYWYFADFNLNF